MCYPTGITNELFADNSRILQSENYLMLLTQGNLLLAPVDALVNTVNTEGVMGKGLALQFRQAYELNYKLYRQACKDGRVRVGEMFVTETGEAFGPRYIINFPTKRHWKEASRMEYITTGVESLKAVLREKGIQSVALPPLGCGNGGLDWDDVRPVIEDSLRELEGEVTVHLYPPTDFVPEVPINKSEALTEARAMMLLAMQAYSVLGFSLTMVEVNKLGYFLHRLGEKSLRLQVKKAPYGPFAQNLRFLLDGLDGVYLRGMKHKEVRRDEELMLIVEKMPAVEAYAEANFSPAHKQRLERLKQVIEGFESPLGMELLATVDYLFHEREVSTAAELPNAIINWGGTANPRWGARKANLMPPYLLDLAADWLSETQMRIA